MLLNFLRRKLEEPSRHLLIVTKRVVRPGILIASLDGDSVAGLKQAIIDFEYEFWRNSASHVHVACSKK